MSGTARSSFDPSHHTIPPVLPPLQSRKELDDPKVFFKGQAPHDFWVFLPSSYPRYFFRNNSKAWSCWRHANVSSSMMRIRNDGGVYSIKQATPDDQQIEPDGQSISAPTSTTENVPATMAAELISHVKGEAYRMTFPSEHLKDSWEPNYELKQLSITLQAGPDSSGQYQSEEVVTGLAVMGDYPLWNIADSNAELDHLESRANIQAAVQLLKEPQHANGIRVFLLPPFSIVANKTVLLAAKAASFSAVRTFKVAAYSCSGSGIGPVLVHYPGATLQDPLIYGTSIVVDSQEDILGCLRFGGGARNATLVRCIVTGFRPDGTGAFATENGFAVVYAGDMAMLCGKEVTARLVRALNSPPGCSCYEQ